jgi:hypothetical protein
MNSLERYQNELIVMALLVGQQDEIINDIKEQKKLQEFYISPEILETLKKIIMENNEKCFIDFRVKNKILDYLSFFRDTNKMLEKENKKETLKKINECIILCNELDTDVDTKVFYANQLYERTQGYYDIDECYEIELTKEIIEIINLSIFQDIYFFDQFMFENTSTNYKLGVYNSEFAIWSVNHFLHDIPELIINENFKENCNSLIPCMKKNIFRIYKNYEFGVANRIKKETKNLQKRLR